jgi:ABC-2 type transport system permease protein
VNVLTLALKDLRMLARDRAGLFWIVGFPTAFALFFGAIFAGFSEPRPSVLRIALVDLDRSPLAAEYVERLGREPGLYVESSDLTRARAKVRAGHLDALVSVRPGFAERVDWYAYGQEVLRIEADPSRRREAAYLQGLLLQVGVASGVEQQLLADPRESVRIAPLHSRLRQPTAAELVAPLAVLWALLGCAAAFAISIAQERRTGTLRRLRSLAVSELTLIAGKGLACWTACMLVAGLMLAMAMLIFGVRPVAPASLACVVVALGFAFAGIMAALSTLGRSERAVAGAGWGTLLALGMLGGVMAPRMVMPAWLDAAGAFSPVRWGLVALEQVLWRAGSVREWAAPCIALVITGFAGLLLGTMVLRRSEA